METIYIYSLMMIVFCTVVVFFILKPSLPSGLSQLARIKWAAAITLANLFNIFVWDAIWLMLANFASQFDPKAGEIFGYVSITVYMVMRILALYISASTKYIVEIIKNLDD